MRSSGNCLIAFNSQLLIITAVGYYTLVKSSPVKLMPAPHPENLEQLERKIGG
jgi:hypothetical protein